MKATFIPADAPMILAERDGSEGVLVSPLFFQSAKHGIVVVAPAGMETDFASIPRGLWNLLPKRGKHDRAAVIHDGGYRRKLLTIKGQPLILPKATVDDLFLEAMQVCGVGWWTRTVMYRGVCWFGGSAYDNGKRIAEAQRVGDETV